MIVMVLESSTMGLIMDRAVVSQLSPLPVMTQVLELHVMAQVPKSR